MIGGPGTAAGIGPDLDAAGAIGGTTVAVAAATFGLIFGSLLGGPIARKLIVKNHLRDEPAEQTVEEDVHDTYYNTHANNFVYGFLLLMFCAGVGNVVAFCSRTSAASASPFTLVRCSWPSSCAT